MDAQVTRWGSKREARLALKGELAPVYRRGFDGVERPARGASRAAYESRDRRVVYKVCYMGEAYGDSDNRSEAETVALLRKSPDGSQYVAPVTTWNIDGVIVNAMPRMAMTGAEFLKSCHDDPDVKCRYKRVGAAELEVCVACEARRLMGEVADDLGVGDMHEGNWCVDQSGRPWITDCNVAYVNNAPISVDLHPSDMPGSTCDPR